MHKMPYNCCWIPIHAWLWVGFGLIFKLSWCSEWLSEYLKPHPNKYCVFSRKWLCVLRTCAQRQNLVMILFNLETMSCHLTSIRIGMVGLCFRSRSLALLRYVWNDVKFSLDYVLCQKIMYRSLTSNGFLNKLFFLDSGYLSTHCFESSALCCPIILLASLRRLH